MIHPCDCCGQPTQNPRFCSRSCGAKVTNCETPKRKPIGRQCSKCGSIFVRSKDHGSPYRCPNCFVPASEAAAATTEKTRKTTLGHLRTQLHLEGKHPSWIHAVVRQHARKIHKRIVPCPVCKYTKHVECCHIREIASFPDSATLGEVNSEDNVVLLCRNCHWEFDHDLLFLEIQLDGKLAFQHMLED